MQQSVCELLQAQVFAQIRALSLPQIEQNLIVCNSPFGRGDIRPGAYLSPEDRKIGKCTNERDEWGYQWQATVVRGASNTRSQDMGMWQWWLQQIAREFNNKRLTLTTMPTGTHFSRAVQATQIKVANDDLKKRDFDAVGVLITVWIFEPRT